MSKYILEQKKENNNGCAAVTHIYQKHQLKCKIRVYLETHTSNPSKVSSNPAYRLLSQHAHMCDVLRTCSEHTSESTPRG